MMRALIDARRILSLILAGIVGGIGLRAWPSPTQDPILGLIGERRPDIYTGFRYADSTLWVSTPLIEMNVVFSLLSIFATRWRRTVTVSPSRPIRRRVGARISSSSWASSTIARCRRAHQRPDGWSSRSAGCTPAWRSSALRAQARPQPVFIRTSSNSLRIAHDPAPGLGGLFLDAKGGFCRHVRDILQRHGRGDGLRRSQFCIADRYNPSHNDLEAYALAYGIATLLTNLFGRGKDPFWQQASTNLVKFVILLHKTLDDYVTLFQVYAMELAQWPIDASCTRLRQGRMNVAPGGASGLETCDTLVTRDRRAAHGCRVAYRLFDELSAPHDVDGAQVEAVKRWFEDDWMRVEPKLRTSIVEAISVFLSLFDDSPRVKYTFCPPKDLYDPAHNPKRRPRHAAAAARGSARNKKRSWR